MAATLRVVSFAPSTAAILVAVGLGAHVAGATVYSLTDKSVVGSWLDPDFSRVGDLDADAVCTCGDLQPDVMTAARNHDYNAVHVASTALDEVFDSFSVICDAASDADAEATLADGYRGHFAHVTDTVAGCNHPAVYYEEQVDLSMAAGNWVPDLVRVADGTALFVMPGERSAEIDPKAVVAANPDHVILRPCGKDKHGDPEAFDAHGWNFDAAVHTVGDSFLNQPSPTVVSSVDRLTWLLHPGIDLPEPWVATPETATVTPTESGEGK